MVIKEVSITAIDFNNLKPEDVFDWLEQWGFKRYVAEEYIIPSKGEDPRLKYLDNSPEGLYTAVIVPNYHKGKFMWIIDFEMFEKIKSYFQQSLLKENQSSLQGETE